MAIKIRPSDTLRFDACPNSYRLSKEGWRALQPSANLAFGTAIHATTEAVVRGNIYTHDQAREVFKDSWDNALASSPLKFGKRFNQGDMEAMGMKMAPSFIETWKDSGFEIVLNMESQMLVEKRMEVEVAPGIVLSAQPDAIVWTRDGEMAVIDYKTAGSASLSDFEAVSDQLTAYQIVVDAHAERFGTPQIDSVGFFEAIKRKTTPSWGLPRMTRRHSAEKVNEYLDKVRWIAADIENGRMPRRSLMAWNSPCKLCDYFTLCHTGTPENVCRKTIIDEGKLDYSDEWF